MVCFVGYGRTPTDGVECDGGARNIARARGEQGRSG